MGPVFPPSDEEFQARLKAVNVARYAISRNHLNGAVTYLSPYLTHGFLSLSEAVDSIQQTQSLMPTDKLFSEFAWRAFFHHVWSHLEEGIFESIRPGIEGIDYRPYIPQDVLEARTGLAVIDQAVQTLYATGYLHNHARMWLASYLIHLRHVHWRAGADWMYGHLLDGDLASNHLSWQWVASSFSVKPYLFNAENVARYAPSQWHCNRSLLDTSYESLEAMARGFDEPRRRKFDASEEQRGSGLTGAEIPDLLSTPPRVANPNLFHMNHVANANGSGRIYGNEDLNTLSHALGEQNPNSIELVHAWSLREKSLGIAGLSSPRLRLGLIHLPGREIFPWSEKRWDFVLQRMCDLCDFVFVGDAKDLFKVLPESAVLYTQAEIGCTETKKLFNNQRIQWQESRPLFEEPQKLCMSFSKYIRAARVFNSDSAQSR